MSDIKATGNGLNLETLTLNTWAQFGAGVRKRVSERITCFLETIIRTGGRDGWGLMLTFKLLSKLVARRQHICCLLSYFLSFLSEG